MRTRIVNMKTVESIYFDTTVKANIREQPNIRDLKIISEKEYREKLVFLGRHCAGYEETFEPDKNIDTLVAVHCVSGKAHYLHAKPVAVHRVQQLMDLHNILGRLTSVIPCSPAGYIAINPNGIKEIEIYPAPKETMLTAWVAD